MLRILFNEKSNYIPYLKIKRETPKAWLLTLEDKADYWLPKSQCTVDEEEQEVIVPAWLAVKKGI